jgi:shikimate kinase
MKKDTIALIGFMGTGKTTVGKALVKRLGNEYRFLETDEIIVKLAGKSIPDIFIQDGEAVFRNYEIEACKMVSRLNKVIISCGGGIVLNQVNIDNLRKNCLIILLITSIEEISNRIIKDGISTRPMINKTEPLEQIKEILEFRRPLYHAAADYVVDTTKKTINQVVKNILAKIDKLVL